MNIEIMSVSMPESVDGVATHLNEEKYVVLLNESLSQAEKEHTIIHEILHIVRNDFDSGKSVSEIETATHRDAEMYFNSLSAAGELR